MNYKIIPHLFIAVIFTTKISISMSMGDAQFLSPFLNPTSSVTHLNYRQACANFDEIKCRLELYKDACEDHLDTFDVPRDPTMPLTAIEFNMSSLRAKLDKDVKNAQTYIDSIVLISDLYKQTRGSEVFCSNVFSVILGGFIKCRFEYLNNRRIKKIEVSELDSDQTLYLRSTYPEYIKSLTEETISSSYQKATYFLAQDFYDAINFCIIELFKMISFNVWKDKSPEIVKTKRLLQYSISLWPELMDDSSTEQNVLRHPDQAIEETQELDLYRKFILRESGLDIRRESLECPLFKEKTSITTTSEKSVDLPLNVPQDNLVVHKKKSKKKKKKSDVNSNVCQKVDVLPESVGINDSEVMQKVAEKEVESIVCEKVDVLPESVGINDLEVMQEVAEKEVENCTQESLKAEVQETNASIEKMDDSEQYQYTPYEKKLDQNGSSKISSSTVVLKGHHRSTFDQIMRTPFSGSLAYRDFVNLWEILGGKIKTISGSHRKLLWNNQCMGGTYEPHGGHGYGFRSVKYLKDSLNKLREISGFKI